MTSDSVKQDSLQISENQEAAQKRYIIGSGISINKKGLEVLKEYGIDVSSVLPR